VLPTTVVAAFRSPSGLVYRDALLSGGVPRVRARPLWRVPEDNPRSGHDDATRLVVRDLERAGVDIVSEARSGARATSAARAGADGARRAKPGTARAAREADTGAGERWARSRDRRPCSRATRRFLRGETSHPIKITVPGVSP